MKFIAPLFFLSACFVFSSCSSEERLPDVIQNGFDQYQKKGAEEAINTWGAAWSEEYAASKISLRNGLIQNEKNFGKLAGYENVKTVAIGKHFQHHYITMLYQTSPVFALFTTYQNPKGDWEVLYIAWNNEIKEIFPPEVYLR